MELKRRLEFCASFADRCAMFFDGAIVAEGTPREFFSSGSFYTTSASRMARGLLPGAITPEDVITACGGGREMNADFSHTCEGCEHVVTEPWAKDIISYRCFAPGRCKGRVVGVKRFDPYIPAWCPKLERSRENG